MNFDYEALKEAQTEAARLVNEGTPVTDEATGQIKMRGDEVMWALDPVPASQITAPGTIANEIPFTVAQNVYEFQFGSEAPAAIFPAAPAIQLNNRILGENNIMSFYGLRLLFGIGLNASDRVYQTTGIVPDDDIIYNGVVSISFASSTPIQFYDSRNFRDEDLFQSYAGFNFVRPLRTFTGSLATMTVRLTLPNITALVLTPNVVLRMELEGAIGIA